MSETFWQPGDVVVLRYVETPESARIVHAYMGNPAPIAGVPFLADGRVLTTMARPYRVVTDSDAFTALYQPANTTMPRWIIDENRYLPNPQVMLASSLRFFFPGKPFDITLFFETSGEVPWFYDPLFTGEGMTPGWRELRKEAGTDSDQKRNGVEGRFRGWYVNLQSPPRRTAYGIDISDLALDVVIRPDHSWYWKDEDELQMALDAGACTPEFASHIRRAGEEVVAMIASRTTPFDDSWLQWKPPPDWAIGEIPDGWQTTPALLDQWWDWPQP
jgi:hypothetical protein